MNSFKFTKAPMQRYPGDRKWKNEETPKSNDKKQK